jgi:hypothetical protein
VQTQVASTDSHTSATVIATSSDEKSVG